MHTVSVVTENESKGNIDWDEWRFIESKRRYIAINETPGFNDI
jgi:hypothetical protein